MSGRKTIGVVGLGYVGLPLAMAFTSRGSRVIGFDVDPEKVRELRAGRSYIRHIASERVAAMRGLFEATDDFGRGGEPDALLLCVPTPLTPQREPDTVYIERTMERLGPVLRKGQLVVLESTTYPGTTREKVVPVIEARGLVVGRDVYVAYSPEREDPGNERFQTGRIPKVVGADDEASLREAVALYGAVMESVVEVSSTATAEAVKLTENIFRGVNIALVNELKIIYERMGIDVWEVIEAARTKPFGYMPFYPGPGLGGHCIPIDPFYLTWKAREYDISTRFIELAGEINTAMPGYVVGRLQDALNERGRSLKDARVLILGLAYKPGVGDMRESPSLRLLDLLGRRGAVVDYHDSFIPRIPASRDYGHLEGIESRELDPEAVAGYDAVLVATAQPDVDFSMVAREARLVVDTRNACPAGPNVVRA